MLCNTVHIYCIYIVKTLQDGVGTSPGATKIVGKKKKKKKYSSFDVKTSFSFGPLTLLIPLVPLTANFEFN